MITSVQFPYLLLFLISTLISFLCFHRSFDWKDRHLRNGSIILFGLNTFWSASEFFQILTTNIRISYILYHVSLVSALFSIYGWLYICSEFTNKKYHKSKKFHIGILSIFSLIALIKITNSLHGLYGNYIMANEPFVYVFTARTILNDVVLIGSYTLSTVGFIWILQRFYQTKYLKDALFLIVFLGIISGLSIFSIIFPRNEFVPVLWYETIGVSVFSAFLFTMFSQHIKKRTERKYITILDGYDSPLIVTENNTVIESNSVAKAIGSDRIMNKLNETNTKELLTIDGTPYQDISFTTTSETNKTQRIIMLINKERASLAESKVLSYENRLKTISHALTHEMRNSLTVSKGNMQVLQDANLDEEMETSVQDTIDSLNRIQTATESLNTLSKSTGNIQKRNYLLSEVLDDLQQPENYHMSIENDGMLLSNKKLFAQLLSRIYLFAQLNDNSEVELTVTKNNSLIVEIDCKIPSHITHDDVFEFGISAPDPKSGSILPVVETIADIHEWQINSRPCRNGFAFEITGF